MGYSAQEPEPTLIGEFPATDAALAARLEAIDPEGYARSRNHLDGAVSQLSPYLTHGFISVPDVVTFLQERHGLHTEHKFIFELAWREYFHHAWTRIGDGILSSLRHPPGNGYRTEIPEDLLTASTGVKVIDSAVRTLYGTGYLHNHARMWLASYAVHLRKVDWRIGADWMYGHLLDGDLPCNHLSWQWVAGTLTGKPYLFNADNVERFAPSMASRRSAIDCSYDVLQHIAESDTDVGREAQQPEPIVPPPLLPLPAALDQSSATIPENRIALIHPWNLRSQTGHFRVLLLRDFHQRWPWSARRWAFLQDRVKFNGYQCLAADSSEIPLLLSGVEADALAADHPVYDKALLTVSRVRPVPRQFRNPESFCSSFSSFWHQVNQGHGAA
jgi:deoxyribodipyrimidine photo-lyase